MLLIFKKVWKKILACVATCALLFSTYAIARNCYNKKSKPESIQTQQGSPNETIATQNEPLNPNVYNSSLNKATSDSSTTFSPQDDYSFKNDNLDPKLDKKTQEFRNELQNQARKNGFSLNNNFYVTIPLPKWHDEKVDDYTDENLKQDVQDLWNSNNWELIKDNSDESTSNNIWASLNNFLFDDDNYPRYNLLDQNEKDNFKRIVNTTKKLKNMYQSNTLKPETKNDINNGLVEIDYIMNDHKNRCVDRLRQMLSQVTMILDNLYYQLDNLKLPNNENVLINELRKKMLTKLEIDTIDYSNTENVEGKVYLNKKYGPLLNIKGMNSNIEFKFCGKDALRTDKKDKIIETLVGYLKDNNLLNDAINDSKNILGPDKTKVLIKDINENVSLTFKEFMQIEGKNKQTCIDLIKNITNDVDYEVNKKTFNNWIKGKCAIKLNNIQKYIAIEKFKSGSVFLNNCFELNPIIVRKYLHDKKYI